MPRRREFPVRDRTFAIADAIQVSRQYFSFLSSPSLQRIASSYALTRAVLRITTQLAHRNRPPLVFHFNPAAPIQTSVP